MLQDITLAIEPGEFFALLGPSGSGKSTLLRLIAGFNHANRGRVLVDGRDISDVPPHARNIGMVFQSYALWPHMSVYDNVAFGLVERRVARSEIKRRVGDACLWWVSPTTRAAGRISCPAGNNSELRSLARSSSNRRCCCSTNRYQISIRSLREQMRLELKRLQRALGITTIFVTHDQEEAMTTADRMAVLDAGVLQQVGRPRELFDAPSNRFVAEFVGQYQLAGRCTMMPLAASSSREDFGDIPLAASTEGNALSIRPHALTIAANRGQARDLVRRRSSGERVPRRVHALSSATRRSGADGGCPHLSATPIYPRGARVQVAIDPAEVRPLA